MNDQPLVSICIPNYNNGQFVGEAIQSALDQTYQNIEVIVVDNCSTDESWRLINSFNDFRLKVYRNSQNIGMYPNFMEAAKYTNGKYIKFICSDDWIVNNYLERSLPYFDDFNIKLITSSQGRYYQDFKKFGPIRKRPGKGVNIVNPKESRTLFLMNTNPVGNPTCVIIRKDEFLRQRGFDLSLKYCNDYDLWMRISMANKVVYLPEILSYERKHNYQATITYNVSGEDIQNIVTSIKQNLNHINLLDSLKLGFFAFLPFYCAALTIDCVESRKKKLNLVKNQYIRFNFPKVLFHLLYFKCFMKNRYYQIKRILYHIKSNYN